MAEKQIGPAVDLARLQRFKQKADATYVSSTDLNNTLNDYATKAELDAIVTESGYFPVFDSWEHTTSAIANDLGPSLMPVGTRLTLPWTVTNGNKVYDMILDTAQHKTAMLENGTTGKVMISQTHHVLPFAMEFSPQQALLYAVTNIPEGTYNITMGFTWGSNVVNGKTYQFTLTNPVPAGGQLTGFLRAPDTAPSTWRVYSYESKTSTTPIETAVVTEGTSGTNLGTFTASGSSETVTIGSISFKGLNSMHRVAYGNNRYKDSPIRQYLNATGSNWWTPSTDFDRPPSYASHKGFLSGFDEGFVSALVPIAVKTALNYVTDGSPATGSITYDTTYDKVFLPSWEEHFLATSQYYGGSAGLEGNAFDLWKVMAGTTSPLSASTWGDTSTYHTQYIQYDMNVQTTPRNTWVRSAGRYDGICVPCVHSQGRCGGNHAYDANCVSAACAIGKSPQS